MNIEPREWPSNTAFERDMGRGGPRLATAWLSWPAAQLGR